MSALDRIRALGHTVHVVNTAVSVVRVGARSQEAAFEIGASDGSRYTVIGDPSALAQMLEGALVLVRDKIRPHAAASAEAPPVRVIRAQEASVDVYRERVNEPAGSISHGGPVYEHCVTISTSEGPALSVSGDGNRLLALLDTATRGLRRDGLARPSGHVEPERRGPQSREAEQDVIAKARALWAASDLPSEHRATYGLALAHLTAATTTPPAGIEQEQHVANIVAGITAPPFSHVVPEHLAGTGDWCPWSGTTVREDVTACPECRVDITD